jgi:Holliday junction resolvase RusA-like endonuclease
VSLELEGEHTNIAINISTITTARWDTDAMMKAIADMMNTTEKRVTELYKTSISNSKRLDVKMVPR